MGGQLDLLPPSQRQQRQAGQLPGQLDPVVGQTVDTLGPVHAPDVERVGLAETEARGQVQGGRALGSQLEPAAHHVGGSRRAAGRLLHQLALLGRQVGQGAGRAEQPAEDAQAHGCVVLGGRHQQGPRGHLRQGLEGGGVAVGVEDERVDVAALGHGPHQARAERAVLQHPGALVFGRVEVAEDDVREEREAPLVARALDREARDRQPVDARRAGRVVVGPAAVVERAGGQDLDLVLAGQAARQPAAVRLGAARDLLAVALHDEAQLHGRGSGRAASSSAQRRSSPWRRASSRTTSRMAWCTSWKKYWLIWVCRSSTWSV